MERLAQSKGLSLNIYDNTETEQIISLNLAETKK